jgi:hypothetical protein
MDKLIHACMVWMVASVAGVCVNKMCRMDSVKEEMMLRARV